jgi:hypothetical protein
MITEISVTRLRVDGLERAMTCKKITGDK